MFQELWAHFFLLLMKDNDKWHLNMSYNDEKC